MASRVTLSLVDGLKFDVHMQGGHALRIDTNEPGAGGDTGPGPMQLVLVALGGCGAMDVISILRKMRQDITTYDVSITADRATEHPKIYTHATVTHRFRGRDLDEANVRRAIYLSIARYCPVFAMLSPTVDIRVAYEITDEQERLVACREVSPFEEVEPVGG
jgi:putative redox protein